MSLRERTRPELGIIEHEARGRRGLGALSREPDGIASSFFHREFYFWGPQRNLVASTKFMPLAWRLNIPLCAQSPRPKLRVRHAELFICEVELSYRGLFLLVAIPVVMMMVARIVGI